MKWNMKRLASIAGAAAIVLAAAACTPPAAPAPTQLSCEGLVANASVSPGVSYTPTTQSFRLSNRSKLTGCTDTLGLGITGGRLIGTTLSFPELDCYGSGATGAGSGAVKWSDGSTSAFTATITLSAPLEASLRLKITSGQFAGSSGVVDVTATPTSGDCVTPIRSESFVGGSLVLS